MALQSAERELLRRVPVIRLMSCLFGRSSMDAPSVQGAESPDAAGCPFVVMLTLGTLERGVLSFSTSVFLPPL